MKYLASRREGLFDWIVFHRPTQARREEMAATRSASIRTSR